MSRSVATMQAPRSNERARLRCRSAGRAGDERDRALELARRRRERQLVELERPVLDRERLRVGERDEAAERGRAAHHGDRPVVQVAREPRRLQRASDRHHADALDEHDPRARIGSTVARARGTPRSTRAPAPGTRARAPRRAARNERSRRRRRDRSRPTAAGACVDEMIGTGGADLRELCRTVAADEPEHGSATRRPGGCAARQPTPRRARAGRTSARSASRCSASSGPTFGRERLAAAVRSSTNAPHGSPLECRGVRRLGRVAPGHEAVLREQDELASGRSATASATSFESAKPGRMYGIQTASEPKHSSASRSPSPAPTIAPIVSGCVWSTCAARDERVQQRLDRRARHRRARAGSGRGTRPSPRPSSPRARRSGRISSSRSPVKPPA